MLLPGRKHAACHTKRCARNNAYHTNIRLLNCALARQSQEFRKSVLTWLMQNTSARVMRWIVCIILKDLKV